MFPIAFTLEVTGWIPSRVIQYPKYSSSSLAKKDFLALHLSPACRSLSKTADSFVRWSS